MTSVIRARVSGGALPRRDTVVRGVRTRWGSTPLAFTMAANGMYARALKAVGVGAFR